MKGIRNFLNIFFISLSSILLMLLQWYKVYFSEISIDQLLFHIMVPLEGTDSNVFGDFFRFSETYILVSIAFIIAMIIYHTKLFSHEYSLIFDTKLFNKNHKLVWKIKDDRNYIFVCSMFLFLGILIYAYQILDVKEYITNSLSESTLIEEYYVNPEDANITFPKQKQNLIYIYLESMESSFSNMDSKYVNQENLIPNLSKYAKNNINFSANESVGGALYAYGTGWTIAGMVAQTSGVPIKIPVDGNSLGEYGVFLPGSYSLGEILEKEGYNQMLFLGSEAAFGGRENYFLQHGNYQIYDYNTAVENEAIPEGYFLNWGIEDLKLFEIAKEELTKLSKEDKPFNFTMLTTDTHFPYGYQDDTCTTGNTNNEYANAVICADKKVADFISWIKKQDFYKNTTIIISGDHLVMGNYLFTDGIIEGRSIYNVIINSRITTDNNKNRIFTVMDMYPTTLASLGVEIEGNRLGLGTNLFSDLKTIPEEVGYNHFNEELAKKSVYYNRNILTKD